MGLFNRLKKKADKAVAPAPKPEVASKEAAKITSASSQPRTGGMRAELLLMPHVSEKAAKHASSGTYVFNVPISANKIEIRKAVEGMYGVNVEAVRMIRGIGKPVSRGKIIGRRNRWKKALVNVKSGQKIDLHEGV